MKLQTRLLLILVPIFGCAFIWTFATHYSAVQRDTLNDLSREADNIRGVLMATRRVYHHQFLESGIPLNEKTIGFLPAHALRQISLDFEDWTNTTLRFNNVSDRPRNPENSADAIELEAMDFFRKNPDKEKRFVPFTSAEGEPFYHYSRPIWVEEYCLKCHGDRESAPATIRSQYANSYNYELGDLRGVMSIKLPASTVEDRAMTTLWGDLWSQSTTLIIAFALIYALLLRYAVKRLKLLEKAAQGIAEGDFTSPTGITGHDEIAHVAFAFDEMSAKLRDREENLRLARDAAEAADYSKSEFLANMSHEIRTPMTAILGFAENIAENVTGDENIEAIGIVRRNGEHLLELINDILDLSKIEAGKIAVETETVNPCTLIADIISLMNVRVDSEKLTFSVEYATAIPESIQTDPTRVRQILINLIGNAIKFTGVGTVRLIVRLVHSDNPHLQFDVKDTGRGLTPKQMTQLFQPFSQADNSTTRKFGGTGLGLSISRRLAQLLGGDVEIVESELDVGSTFRATIPIGPLDGIQMLQDPASSTIITENSTPTIPANDRDLQDCRILLAEDNPANRVLVMGLLQKVGATVTAVENGQLAVDAAMARHQELDPFDIILMDMQMPILGGIDATRQLRQKGYQGTIIALTAHTMADDEAKCLKAGCDAYAIKPINRKKLIATIQQHWTSEHLAEQTA